MPELMRLLSLTIAISAPLGGALAQDGRDPADPSLRVRPFDHVSPFADYRRYEEVKVAPWRELNDQVLGLGGHAGHIRNGGNGGNGAVDSMNPPATSNPVAPRSPRGEAELPQPAGAPRTDHSIHKR